MSTFFNVIKREIKRIFSSRQIIFFVFFAPLLTSLLIFLVFLAQSPKNLPIALIDFDNSKTSREFSRMLSSAPSVSVDYKLNDFRVAQKLIQKSDIYAIITIPENFETDINKGNSPNIDLKYNNQFLLMGGIIYKDIMTVYKTFLTEKVYKNMLKSGINFEKAKNIINPIILDEHIKSNPYLNYGYFLILGAIGHLIQIFSIFSAIWAVGREYKYGTGKEWLSVADNNIFIAVFGKLTPFFISYYITGIFVFLMFFIVYKAEFNGNLLFLALSFAIFILAYQMMGVLFVAIGKNMRLALSAGAFYTALGFTFAGITFPIMAMPLICKIYAGLLPLKYYMIILTGQVFTGIPVKFLITELLSLIIFIVIPLLFVNSIKKSVILEENWYKG